MLVVLAIGAAPCWYMAKGYRRARWADERGIELVAKIEFRDFAPSLRASEGAALGRRAMHAQSYDRLKKRGALDEEAGGDFWSGFYAMGTQLYHHTAGNRTTRPLPAVEMKGRERRATEQRERKNAAEADRSERLVKLLGHDDFRKREAATEELRRMGPTALPYLRKAATSSDPDVAERAGTLLKQVSARMRRRATRQLPPGTVRRLMVD